MVYYSWEVKVPEFLVRALFLACRKLPPLYSSHGKETESKLASTSSLMSLLRKTLILWDHDSMLWFYLILITSLIIGPISKYSHLGVWSFHT